MQLRDLDSQLRGLGFQIIAISPDQPAKLRETIEKHNLSYQLASDSTMAAAEAFGIAYKVNDATLKALTQHGIDLEAASGEKHRELPVPAVFVVATSGLIQFEYVNPDYSVRVHPDLLLTAASVSRK